MLPVQRVVVHAAIVHTRRAHSSRAHPCRAHTGHAHTICIFILLVMKVGRVSAVFHCALCF